MKRINSTLHIPTLYFPQINISRTNEFAFLFYAFISHTIVKIADTFGEALVPSLGLAEGLGAGRLLLSDLSGTGGADAEIKRKYFK